MTTLIAAQAIERSTAPSTPLAAAAVSASDVRWAEWSDRYARDDRRAQGRLRMVALLIMAAVLVWTAIALM